MPRDFSPRELDEFERSQGESAVRAVDREAKREARETNEAVFRTHEPTPKRPRDDRGPEIQFRDGRAILYDRDRTYELSESEIRTVVDLGKFRVIATENLAEHAYTKDRGRADRDVWNLVRHGLVRRGFFEGPEAHPRELLTLTKRGHRLLRKNRLAADNQATYSGFVKPREANHDADLYLLYQKEGTRIEAQGGRHLRVILDYELKRKINREFAKLGSEARQEIAAWHGLEVVRGKIPIPDLRIEYETREGEMARVNLELVTEHYRGRHVADKVHAGFSLYTPTGGADRLRRVLDQRELTAEILSL
jgi:hypothetical protein